MKAIFQVKIIQLDHAAKQKLESEVRALSLSTSISSGLPPPSSDDSQWWETHTAYDCPPTTGPNPFFDFAPAPRPVPPRPPINLMD